jgi:hypothetical protein
VFFKGFAIIDADEILFIAAYGKVAALGTNALGRQISFQCFFLQGRKSFILSRIASK